MTLYTQVNCVAADTGIHRGYAMLQPYVFNYQNTHKHRKPSCIFIPPPSHHHDPRGDIGIYDGITQIYNTAVMFGYMARIWV